MRDNMIVLFIVVDEVSCTVDDLMRVLCVFEDAVVDVRVGELPVGHIEVEFENVNGVMLSHVCDAFYESRDHVRCVLYNVGILEYVKWLRHEVTF